MQIFASAFPQAINKLTKGITPRPSISVITEAVFYATKNRNKGGSLSSDDVIICHLRPPLNIFFI
jgi:hypothetical protein